MGKNNLNQSNQEGKTVCSMELNNLTTLYPWSSQREDPNQNKQIYKK